MLWLTVWSNALISSFTHFYKGNEWERNSQKTLVPGHHYSFIANWTLAALRALPLGLCWGCVALSECSVWRRGRTAGRHSPPGPEDSACSQTAALWAGARDCWSDTPHGPSAALLHYCRCSSEPPGPVDHITQSLYNTTWRCCILGKYTTKCSASIWSSIAWF